MNKNHNSNTQNAAKKTMILESRLPHEDLNQPSRPATACVFLTRFTTSTRVALRNHATDSCGKSDTFSDLC